MAERVEIKSNLNAVSIAVDGNEIHGIQAYKLEEDEKGAVLTLVIHVSDTVDVQMYKA